jgi:hypothetical protein
VIHKKIKHIQTTTASHSEHFKAALNHHDNLKLADKSLVSLAKNCVTPDIEQFPKSIFNQTQRRHGALLFHFLVAFYMFIGLALVCDDYFVPSMQCVCNFFNIRQDVAG